MNFGETVIILPTYNERDNVVALIRELFELMPDLSVLVVDDNSPDGTAAAVVEVTKTFPRTNLLVRQKKEGLGRAYLEAFSTVLQSPHVEWLIMMDADHSHDPQYLPRMREAAEGADVIIGSRYVVGGDTVGWELWRTLLSRYANLYCRFVTGMPVRDATAGFTMLRAGLLRRVPFSLLSSSGYAFQMELKHFLWRHGARFAEVPIIFKERREGESKISGHIIGEGIIAPWKMRLKK
jgi:dolichol-phosphate mannosyltransferase